MSFRSKVLCLVDVILRVPSLFIIDELFRISLGLAQTDESYHNQSDTTDTAYTSGLSPNEDGYTEGSYEPDVFSSKFLFITFLKVISSLLGCLAATCVFMLWTKHLVIVYMYLICVGIVFISYWVNVSTMKTIISATHGSVLEDILSLNIDALSDHDGPFMALFQNYLVQIALAYVFSYVHLGPRYSILKRLLPTFHDLLQPE